jgi:hypothetical protein
MPYGVDKSIGGDDGWMESCVMKVMKTGKDKQSAIRICKSSLDKSKDNKAKAEVMVDLYLTYTSSK